MECKRCDIACDQDEKTLKCFVCNGEYHLSCLDNITESDFDYIIGSGTNWKCPPCEKLKTSKNDETPVTPTSLKDKGKYVFGDSESSSGTGNAKNPCFKCKKGFSNNAHRAYCVKCKAPFHFKCINTNKEDFAKLKLTWLCSDCELPGSTKLRPRIGSDGGSGGVQGGSQVLSGTVASVPDSAIMAVLHEMRAFRTEMNQTQKEMKSDIAKHSDWVKELSDKLNNVSLQVNDFIKQLDAYKQENIDLKLKLIQVTEKLENLEQASKEKIVEIQGVPFVKNENILELLSKISNVVGFDFDEKMIDKCFRLKNFQSSERPGVILAKFVRKIDMENFLMKRKQKRNVNSRDLGFIEGEASVIYVNCSLTQERRKLLSAARKVRLEKHYTFLWVSNGRIMMRKNPGDRVVVINSQGDLDKLL